MEEMYWKQFWETGNITDYLAYKNTKQGDLESEEERESDYSDRYGASGIAYR